MHNSHFAISFAPPFSRMANWYQHWSGHTQNAILLLGYCKSANIFHNFSMCFDIDFVWWCFYYPASSIYRLRASFLHYLQCAISLGCGSYTMFRSLLKRIIASEMCVWSECIHVSHKRNGQFAQNVHTVPAARTILNIIHDMIYRHKCQFLFLLCDYYYRYIFFLLRAWFDCGR